MVEVVAISTTFLNYEHLELGVDFEISSQNTVDSPYYDDLL